MCSLRKKVGEPTGEEYPRGEGVREGEQPHVVAEEARREPEPDLEDEERDHRHHRKGNKPPEERVHDRSFHRGRLPVAVRVPVVLVRVVMRMPVRRKCGRHRGEGKESRSKHAAIQNPGKGRETEIGPENGLSTRILGLS